MPGKAKKAAGKGKRGNELRRFPRIDERGAADFVSLQEIVLAARRNLTQELWDHLSGGSDSETTLLRNRQALDCLALRQRVLVNVAEIDITTTLLGQKLASPVFLAPVGGFLGMAHPEGACTVARAAVARGTTAFISTAAKPGIEQAAAAVREPLLFQLYVRSDRKWVEDILDLATAAGYRALCVCVDRNYYGRRERDIISRANVREGFGDPKYQMALNWDDLGWMKRRMGKPLILKGIATAEDARLAVEHGADVVYVSNHGGRQLDHARASIEVLPEVVEAVGGRAEVLFDGGVLRGTDVIKAIALGARAVGVGKLLGWALAAAGEAGIVRMLELMDIEIRTALGLMGVTSLAQLNPSWVRPAQPVRPASQTNGYPWFEEQNIKGSRR
ncbi:MAG: alpha-hydroxy-acid oxidizing protein [Betaproteobacteria bacterium]|nr:alpha-hydroxy-acid oxidizing protein [Betaproteobacteria bacterium]